MSQQRITLFFPYISRKKTSQDSRCRFLELPASIRLQIYYEAGLVSGKTIHLNYWGSRKQESTSQARNNTWWDAHLSALPLNLFAVCHSVHNELRKVLYGENRLVVSRKAPRGLRVLERLGTSTLREIRFLVIRVNVSSCESRCCGARGHRCGNNWHRCLSPSSHDLPLSSNIDQLVIAQWQRLCTQLASSVQPGNLALYVTCDCADVTTAQMIAEKLRLLPALRDCGLRLAIQAAEDIKAVTKDTAMYLTHSSPPPPPLPFRFLNLPKEIQLHILAYTGLVPCAEIVCTQKQLHCWISCRSRGTIATSPGIDTALLKCFCSAAHSAFSLRCCCVSLTSPFAMFLVSREVRDHAMEVFYGQNSFSVSMEQLVSLCQDSTTLSSRLDTDSEGEITEQLSEVSIVPGLAPFPPTSIGRLTSLRLLFEYSDLEHLQPNQAGWGNWLRTIDTLSREANLAALTLQIHMSEKFYPDFDDEKLTFSPIYESFMQQTYENLVRPMKVLRGRLKNLFIHLNWDTSSGFSDGRREHEQMLERIVMGQTYDAWKCGKTIRYPGRYERALEQQQLLRWSQLEHLI
jgi:hypothetical protein